MIEVLRRVVLATGLVAAIVLALYTPPLLLRAYSVNFARDYEEYGQGSWPGNLAESLIDKPATLEQYIEEKVGKRRVSVSGDAFVSFVSRLKSAAAATAEMAPATTSSADGPDIFLRPGDPPLDALMPSFQASRDSGWLNTYVAVDTPAGWEFFEVLLVTEPRNSAAPSSMVHPLRPYAWWALVVAAAAYVVLPLSSRRSPRTVTYDPLGSVLPLDVLGALWLSVCTFVPLWATNTTAEALGEELGITVSFGALGLLAVPAFVSAARRAAFSVAVEPGRLTLSSLGGRREVRLDEIAAVDDLVHRDLKSGVILRLADQDAIRLDWTDLERFELVLEACPRRPPA